MPVMWLKFSSQHLDADECQDWCCSDECRGKYTKTSTDFKYQYSRAVAFAWLQQEVRHQAVRDGDGEAVNSFWRIDNIFYLDGQHWRYRLIATRMLAGIIHLSVINEFNLSFLVIGLQRFMTKLFKYLFKLEIFA